MRMRAFTYRRPLPEAHDMSERKRQLARLRKQRQRSYMNQRQEASLGAGDAIHPALRRKWSGLRDYRQEARRHQHASRAAENEQRR